MSQAINRRQFLSGDFQGKELPIMPPWALNEDDFEVHCTSCGDCIRHCPESILIIAGGGYPRVDFSQGECSFCQSCVDICQSGALVETAVPWELELIINKSCLAKKGVVCSVCAEQCDARALRFKATLGSVAQPSINIIECTGCGACIASCPSDSISLSYKNEGKEF